MKKFILFLAVAVLAISCDPKEEVNPDKLSPPISELVGTWKLTDCSIYLDNKWKDANFYTAYYGVGAIWTIQQVSTTKGSVTLQWGSSTVVLDLYAKKDKWYMEELGELDLKYISNLGFQLYTHEAQGWIWRTFSKTTAP